MGRKDVKVHISTTADVAAAKKVEAAFGGVEKAADRAGKALTDGDAKQAAKEFDRLGDELHDVRQEAAALGRDAKSTNKGLAQMERGARGVSKELGKAKKSQKNFGMATLEASRAIEDMQYGVRGVLNNIPQLVMFLGAGAGLAGAISVAAVAAAQLGPLLLKMGRDGETGAEMLAQAEEYLAESVEEANRRVTEAKKQAAKESGDAIEAAAQSEQRSLDATTAAMERQIAVMHRRSAAAMEDVDRGAALEMLAVNASGASDTEKIRERARIAEQAERKKIELQKQALKEELAARKRAAEEAARAQEDVRRRLSIVSAANEGVAIAGVEQKAATKILMEREGLASGLKKKTAFSAFLDVATAGLNPWGNTKELAARTGRANLAVSSAESAVDDRQAAAVRAHQRMYAVGASPEEEADLRARLARLSAEAAQLQAAAGMAGEDYGFEADRLDAGLAYGVQRRRMETTSALQSAQNAGLSSVASAVGPGALSGLLGDNVANQDQSGEIITALYQALGSKAVIEGGLLDMVQRLIAEQERIAAQVEQLRAAGGR